MEDQSIFEHLEVWGQPRAWTDELIASWTIDFIREQYGQSLCFADCLSSQWSPSVTLRAWLKGVIWAPMAPDVTSFLQEPDTHEHSQMKAMIRAVKAETHFALETEWKEASKLKPGLKYPNCWGPYECLYVIGKALERFKARFPQVPLEGLQAVQMLRVRPTIDGRLEKVTGREPWSHKITPGRGISMKLQEARDEIIDNWPENIPPEPDWSQLDGEAFFQADIAPPERPADEELVLDFDFADLELTEHQKIMLVPPEKRLVALNFPASLRRRAHQRAIHRKNRWAEKFTQHCTGKFAKKWRKRASEQGGLTSLGEKSQGTAKVAPSARLPSSEPNSRSTSKPKPRPRPSARKRPRKASSRCPYIYIYIYI
jgi:hypothetical protein